MVIAHKFLLKVTCDDIERGFRVWRQHPDRIVGFYPRLIDGSPLKYRGDTGVRKQSKRGNWWIAISRNTKVHYQVRSNCLLKFSEMYGSLAGHKWEFDGRKDGWDL
ncbi:hypothetical protein CMV_013618 [Castanea mollissima]|uniref:Glycosyl transferase 64 domain-containing protein n=1 Tax=Castanea mollissima TaxID=60419 RepID=A0A8J4QZ43_9ROSI|nr:hypothetical protein CMV_013618 [Castanea mollissima]